MFFNSKRVQELENRVLILEKALLLSLQTQDELIKAFSDLYEEDKRLDLEIRHLTVEYLLHKVQKYHVVKDKDGKFQPDKLDISSEKEFSLISILTKIGDKLKTRD